MQLYSQIEIPCSEQLISHENPILLLGSCFAEHMAQHLSQAGFQVCHPFGALYNPISIVQSLQRLQANKEVTSNELFQNHDQWNHFDFHSQYSASTPEKALEQMNQAVHQGHAFLQQKPVIIFTLGTSWTYVLKATGKTVANCHRVPSAEFQRKRLTQAEIEQTLQEICDLFPNQLIIFTVSPIRHFKDGAHENQLSKALLLLAVDAICHKNANAQYFPAYEIVLDELRDYRFYKEDLQHPSPVAVQYIWERFNATYFNTTTQQACRAYEKISQMEQHRPFDASSEASEQLAVEIKKRKQAWKNQYEKR